jgi:hypothetical protein
MKVGWGPALIAEPMRAIRRVLMPVLTRFLAPAGVYFLVYAAFSWPLFKAFNTHFFCGQEDGYQNIWNLWWTEKCVNELHQLPWQTNYLHHPRGTTLIAHTLAPFNGFVGAFLQKTLGLSLNQTYNFVVIFSFVMSGVTAFWLALRVSGSYAGSLFAGAAFTFTHFHFAHAQNHLQMVSLEWLPLAVLAVYELVNRPTLWKAVAAAGALFLVALCDFHLTFYVVMAGSFLGLIILFRQYRSRFNGLRPYVVPLIVFVTLTAMTTGMLALKLLLVNKNDPLQHNHDPVAWSTDVIDPLIPGAQWKWNAWTRPVWEKLDKEKKDFVYVEHSLYVGWAVFGLLVYGLWRRARMPVKDLGYWYAMAGLFFLMSLGPWLHVAGTVTKVPLVYRGLEWAFPPLKMGGVPMRMMVMVYVAGAVIAACAIGDLIRLMRWKSLLVLIPLLGLWTFETWPKAQPTTKAGYAFWVTELAKQPPGAVIDTTYKTELSLPLYYATGHGKPIAEGYISRYPRSVERHRGELRALVDAQRWDVLAGPVWNFKYLVVREHVDGLERVIGDGEVRVYKLKS